MDKVKAWLNGRRAFQRWRLLLMFVSTLLGGFCLGIGEYGGAILLLFSLWEMTAKSFGKGA